MKLFPAIDILDGNCVRLLHGKFNEVTIYGSPLEMAFKWENQGADYLHIVDLNGALSGKQGNLEVIQNLVKSINIPIQMGGGIRSLDDIKLRLEETGVERVILGTVCCQNPDLVEKAISIYGNEKIVCGIDAKDGNVAIKGWTEASKISPIDLGNQMKNIGVKYVVYTDISRDGALTGVNSKACIQLAEATNLNVIASGGVNSLNDISTLKSHSMYGIILGKALYANKFSVRDAVELLKNI